jgi:hypothetical protein
MHSVLMVVETTTARYCRDRLNDMTKSADFQGISGITETDQRIEEMDTMKNRVSKLIYGLLIPAIVALMAVACNASAVWGS